MLAGYGFPQKSRHDNLVRKHAGLRETGEELQRQNTT